jgi:hypothetical protein
MIKLWLSKHREGDFFMTPRPRSSKTKHQIALEPKVMRTLRILAVEHGKPIGDIIQGLVDFTESARFVSDEMFVKRFNALLETCLANAGSEAGWIVPEGNETAVEFVKRKTLEDLEAQKAELEAELHMLEVLKDDPDYPEVERKQKKIMDDLRSGKRGTREK